MLMHMAGFALWRPSSIMKTIHHAYMKVMKIMTCTMRIGRLQNDFMRDLSSHHKVATKVADDHQVYMLQLKNQQFQEREL